MNCSLGKVWSGVPKNSFARVTWDGTTLARCDLNSEIGTYNGRGIITWSRANVIPGYIFQWIKDGKCGFMMIS